MGTRKSFRSPQSLTIDGFEAVRDGRTVYVNAANMVDSNGDGSLDKMYTNIYLMSYTQDSESATVDIFGQALSHWKFLTNITGTGVCNNTTATACAYDSECPEGEYYTGPKAKIIRDTKRLSDLADIDSSLEAYRDANGYYPKLSSGSYIPNTTVSVWAACRTHSGRRSGYHCRQIINALGDCGGDSYNRTTCWDESAKKFAIPT